MARLDGSDLRASLHPVPISDPEIPLRFLSALEDARIRYVVLHGEDRLGTSQLGSDLDLLVDRPSGEVLALVKARLHSEGLRAVVVWPYDVAGAAAVFVGSRSSARGAQIDLLHDPTGAGRYGLRSNAVLSERRTDLRFPVPAALDQQLYLLRKAASKHKREVVREIVSKLNKGLETDSAITRAHAIFSRAAAREVESLLAHPSRSLHLVRWGRVIATIARWVRRVAQPAGHWVELVNTADSRLGDELGPVLKAWLLRVEWGPRPASRFAATTWWLRRIVTLKIRAGVFVSWALEPSWPYADVEIAVDDNSDLAFLSTKAIDEMSARIGS